MDYLFSQKRFGLKRRSESGQGLVEYGVILILVAVFLMVMISLMGDTIRSTFANFIEAPKAPPNIQPIGGGFAARPATPTPPPPGPQSQARFSSNGYTVVENGGAAVITVNLTQAVAGTVQVTYQTQDGSGTNGAVAGLDYVATSGALTFNPGEVTKTFSVTILDNDIPDGDKQLRLQLINVAGGVGMGSPSEATLTIIDDEGGLTVSFSQASYYVNENAAVASINVILSQASPNLVTVDVATSDGTATAGEDYIPHSAVISFLPGTTSRTFTVTILDDDLYEDDETIILTLSNPFNAIIGGDNPAQIVIVNNDPPPTVSFSQPDYFIDRDGGAAVIQVNLSAVSGVAATVNFAASDDTAVDGEDYQAVSGTLTFPPGVVSQEFTVPILNNPLNTTGRTVNLALSAPSHANIGGANPAVLTIAGFITCHSLNNTISPNGSGQVLVSPEPNCNGNQYLPNTVVNLTAVPANGFLFSNWSGDITSGNDQVALTMDGDKNVTATFSSSVTTTCSPTLPLLAQINFQRTNDTAPTGYLADAGHAFGDRGNGFNYGWSGDNTGQTRRRNNSNSPDIRYDTLNHMQLNGTFTWEIAVPNGVYQVCIVAGDPSHNDSVYRLTAEGVLTVDHVPTSGANRWGTGFATVSVTDGRLTIGNGNGSSNNKINFIQIYTQPACYQLMTTIEPVGAGSIAVNPAPDCNDNTGYTAGTEVSLTAAPTAGYTFANWSGAASGTNNQVTVTMSENRSVTANFDPQSQVLLVVGNAGSPHSGDVAIRNRLEGMDYNVTLVSASAVQASDATGMDLIFISHTAGSTNGGLFSNTPVPLISSSRNNFISLGLSGNINSSNNITQLQITAPSGHPLAAGLSGNNIAVTSSNSRFSRAGALGAGAVSIASATNNTGRHYIFAYETDTTMASGTAPARRVGFFMGNDDTPTLLNANGWALFDAAVSWAINN